MIRVLTFIIIFIAGKVSFGQDTNYIVKWFYEEQYDKIVNELEPLVPEAKKKYGDKDTVIYGNLIYSIAYAYYNLNNYDKALVYYRDAQKVFEKTNGEASIKYFNIIDRIGDIYHETKSLDFQLKFYEIHLKKHKLKFGEDNLRFGNLVWKIAVVYSDLEDYDTSIIYYEQARKIFERNKYNDSIAYADLMGQLADLYFEKSEYEEAWKVAQLSNKIFNNFYNEQLKGYYISNLLVIKIADKLDKDAIKLEKMIENISIYEALNEGNAVIYLEDVLETAELAFDSEAYDLSKKYFEKSRSIFENSKREDIYLKLYIDLMISTSDYYLGAYLESVKELESILKSVSQVGKNKGNYYLKTINHMLASYLRLNAYTEIDNLIKRSKIDSLNKTEVSIDNVVTNYILQAQYYRAIGQYDKAINIIDHSIKKYLENDIDKLESDLKVSLLNGKALNYQSIGKMNESLEIQEEILKNADTIDNYNLLFNIGNIYSRQGNYEKAYQIFNKVFDILDKTNQTYSEDYFRTMIELINIEYEYGQVNDAISWLEGIVYLTDSIFGDKSDIYSIAVNNLAVINDRNGNYNEAVELYAKIVKPLTDSVLDINQIVITENLASSLFCIGEQELSIILFERALSKLINTIYNNILYLNEDKRTSYIITLIYKFYNYNSHAFRLIGTDSDTLIRQFDHELAIKGLLNHTSSVFLKSSLLNNDTLLNRKFNEFNALKILLAKEAQRSIISRKKNIDALLIELEEIENSIQTIIKRNTIFDLRPITWEKVEGVLTNNEIAIEFSSFPYHNGQRWTDSTYYVALVLGKDYKHPKMIKLFEERELRALMPDATQSSSQDFNLAYQGSRGSGVAYYGQSNSTGDQLYELIWKPLDSLIEGINTVYYANSGLLHKVNLAALPAPDGKLLLERFQLNQLSSTRNLVLKEEEKPMSNAVVYGGIHYDMQQEQLANAVASVSTDTLEYEWLGATISYPELRGYAGKYGGFNYLPGSLYEAQQVAYHLEEAMETRLITGDKAVEESFTQLSGNSSPSVIHIATHGFYFPDTITQVTDRDMLLMGAMGEERFRIYDDPLLRSALVMAGANRSWLGEELPPGAEDGILTAKDVSAMNLSNTELVVLSACQTGLGEVDGTEGVTGLQRGFKIAGVKYVMMSLWPVPDKETAEFMETFYSYWGEGIREAFHKTQQFMANKYRNEPYKWAGFVLVE